jgi:hypothetical protein
MKRLSAIDLNGQYESVQGDANHKTPNKDGQA